MGIKALIDGCSWRTIFRGGRDLFFMPELRWLFSKQAWQAAGEP